MSRSAPLESSLWTWLSGARQRLPDLHMTRIENSAGQGTPDVEGYLKGQFWIELKAGKLPASPTDTPYLEHVRPAQCAWLQRRWSVGGSAWVLLQLGSGPSAVRLLIPGELASVLRHREATVESLVATSARYGVDGDATPSDVVGAASRGRKPYAL